MTSFINGSARKLKQLGLFTLPFMLAAGAETQAAAKLTAKVVSGVAPLPVLFDARASTSSNVSDPFHDLVYTFDFGEKRANSSYSETWGLDGDSFLKRLSKDQYVGAPLAGHVYETPGTYTARVTTTDPNGNTSTANLTITVKDPNSVFSGSNTICYSTSGNFSGCPSGAKTVKSSSFSSAASEASKNKRVLLRRGETFSGSGEFVPSSAAILGAYGSGSSRPKVKVSGNTTAMFVGGNGARTQDIEFISSITSYPDQGSASVIDRNWDAVVRNGLLLRIKTTNGAHGVSMKGLPGGPSKRNQMSIVDSDIGTVASCSSSREGGKNIHGDYTESFIMGNLLGKSPCSFNIRIYSNNMTLWSFNKFDGEAPWRTAIRLQAAGGTAGDGADVPTEHFVFSYNTYNPNHNSAGEVKPPSTSFYNILRNYIVEGNYFANCSRMRVFGQSASMRNNVGCGSGGPLFTVESYQMTKCNGGFCTQYPAKNLNIYNNTCYLDGSDSSIKKGCVESYVGSSALSVRNNLLYAPNASNPKFSSGNMKSSNNVIRKKGESSPLVSNRPSDISDFIRIPSIASQNVGASLDGLFSSEEGESKSSPPVPPEIVSN